MKIKTDKSYRIGIMCPLEIHTAFKSKAAQLGKSRERTVTMVSLAEAVSKMPLDLISPYLEK